MIPLETLDRVQTPDGQDLALYHRDGHFQIRIDGFEVMSSRAHGSEESLAVLAYKALGNRAKPRILIGGLGMGYTLRAALRSFPRQSRIMVAEIFPAVVEWNRGPLAHLAHYPLKDPRLRLEVGDVSDVLGHNAPVDALLLDVDNGPTNASLASNEALYSPAGLTRIRDSLAPRGVLAVWSPDRTPAFEKRLRRIGFQVTSTGVPARGRAGGPRHTIYVAVATAPRRSQA